MSRFRMAVSYRGKPDLLKRPPLPHWIADELEAEIMALPAKHGRRIRYVYYRKIYWATPPWLNKQQMKQMKAIYAACPKGSEIDHIVPLKSKLVCGLNVPWNLQELTIQANQAKGNHHWPDMPDEPTDLFDRDRFKPFELALQG